MRKTYKWVALAGFAAVALASAPAVGQSEVIPSGRYAISFEEVANSCEGDEKGLALERGTLQVSSRGAKVTLNISPVPTMKGTGRPGGKVRASSQVEATPVDGLTGRFTVAGRIVRPRARLVLIAEYFRGDRPVCTQSWNMSGPRK